MLFWPWQMCKCVIYFSMSLSGHILILLHIYLFFWPFLRGTVPSQQSLHQISEGECSICCMTTKKESGWRAKRIWLMLSASLYIHDYFLESNRQTWLIQMVSLIRVSAVNVPLSLPLFFTGISSLSFSSPPGCVYKPPPLLFYPFNWLDVTDYIHRVWLKHRPLASMTATFDS